MYLVPLFLGGIVPPGRMQPKNPHRVLLTNQRGEGPVKRNLTTTQPWEQALLPMFPLRHPRPRLCPLPSVSLLLPIWSTICGHLPPPLLSPIPAVNLLLSASSLFLSPALTWVTPQVQKVTVETGVGGALPEPSSWEEKGWDGP